MKTIVIKTKFKKNKKRIITKKIENQKKIK